MTRAISDLRNRAEAIGCRVRVFRRTDYRCGGKPVKYSLVVNSNLEDWSSNLAELKRDIQRRERIFAKVGQPTHGVWRRVPT